MRVPKIVLPMLAALTLISCNDAGLAGPSAVSPTAAAASADSEAVPSLEEVARYVVAPGQKGTQRARQVIGPEGGSVRLHDFEVVVPAGAVDRATIFEIMVLPDQSHSQRAWAVFKPHNQKFAVPVILRVPYATTESLGADAHVLWWNGGSWTELETAVTPDGRLETLTDHFSTYATQRKRGITVIGG